MLHGQCKLRSEMSAQRNIGQNDGINESTLGGSIALHFNTVFKFAEVLGRISTTGGVILTAV